MREGIDFAQRYATGQIPWDSGIPDEELVRVLDTGKLKGRTVLEFGCGTGTNAVELARRGFQVTAVDLVEQAVQSARDKARRANVSVEFRVGNVLNDGVGGPYDILFDRGVYHGLRLDDLKGFQEMLRRVTRPGSWWLSLAGNANEKWEGDGPPVVHEHEIRAELGPLFEIVELREYRFTTNQIGFRPLAWSILMRRK
jgi:SAM-dependent methyltransferase